MDLVAVGLLEPVLIAQPLISRASLDNKAACKGQFFPSKKEVGALSVIPKYIPFPDPKEHVSDTGHQGW